MARKRKPRGLPPRPDQLDTFVLLRSGEVVVWYCGVDSHLFHATEKGYVSVCPRRARVREYFGDGWEAPDRSRDIMTCRTCQELVRRLPRRPAAQGSHGTAEPSP